MHKVYIIILNWNRPVDTIKCLESVYKTTYENIEVVLVDNGSNLESWEVISAWADRKMKVDLDDFKPECKAIEIVKISQEELKNTANIITDKNGSKRRLIYIRSEQNLGFAGGNNLGISYVLQDKQAKYIMFLNNDTLMESSVLTSLVECIKSDKLIGSVQPKIVSMSDATIIEAKGIMLDRYGEAYQIGVREKDSASLEMVCDVLGSCAAAALYRVETLKEIGLFDADFFAYYEDVDLALRAKRAGWSAKYVPNVVVHHKHSVSFGENSPHIKYFLTRNQYYYIIKNLSFWLAARFLLVRPIIIVLKVIKMMQTKQALLITSYLKGNFDGFINIFCFLRKRVILKKHYPLWRVR